MQDYAVYDLKSGLIYKTVSLPAQFKGSIRLEDGQGIVEVPRVPDDTKECIKDGELTPIN